MRSRPAITVARARGLPSRATLRMNMLHRRPKKTFRAPKADFLKSRVQSSLRPFQKITLQFFICIGKNNFTNHL